MQQDSGSGSRHAPDGCGVVSARGHNPRAVGTEPDGSNLARVSVEDCDRVAGRGVPDTHKPVLTAGYRTFAVRTERRDDRSRVTVEHDAAASGRVPDQCAAVVPARDHARAVATERDVLDRRSVSVQGVD
jgi:hypothetical protein